MFGVVTRQPAQCYVPGCAGHHPRHDCPKLFAQMYPGRTMPGFGEDGLRAAHAWKGDEVTQQTLQQWQRMQRQGFFVRDARGNGLATAEPFRFR
eukprot:2965931-Rhodomonas_salina.2